MNNFFISIYHYFNRHKLFFYVILTVLTSLLLFFSLKVNFEEDITQFFPNANKQTATVFKNLKLKDRIVVMISSADSAKVADPDQLIIAAAKLEQRMKEKDDKGRIKEIFLHADAQMIDRATQFIYANLPLFLTDSDYSRIDSMLTAKAIDRKLQSNFNTLVSPMGVALKSFIMQDPLGLGNSALESLKALQMNNQYVIYDSFIFSTDMKTLLFFITPKSGSGSTGENDQMIKTIEESIHEVVKAQPEFSVDYFGGSAVAVYNARQIKQDTMLTLTIALIIIITFILLVFKKKTSLVLILLPVLFGGLFSLTCVYFIKGSISAISIGAGAAVLGIALSYSIHVFSHLNHVESIPQLIKELAYPLTIGSFTTIGAFIGLLFTSSPILRDFGLFSAFTLIGTTLFCIIFLPHFLQPSHHLSSGRLLRLIERLNSYPFERNRTIIFFVSILFIICLFTSNQVRFDSNMMNLNYMESHLKVGEEKLKSIFQSKDKSVLFVSTGNSVNSGIDSYHKTNLILDSLKREGKITGYASVQKLLLNDSTQQQRIDKWNRFWTSDRKAFVKNEIIQSGASLGFKDGMFDPFFTMLDKEYSKINYTDSVQQTGGVLNDWVSYADSCAMITTSVQFKDADKEAVYRRFDNHNSLVVFDQAYFVNKWSMAINDDFTLILAISSILIFLSLFISYGRIELALMTFLPMMISWIIILGLMAIFGIEFNIVNIILSTFIFGIGDDFSIFIMDGLQSEYSTGKKLLNAHKTAIFFSFFTTLVGMGVLIFAKHPALNSVSTISMLGMITVILITYTIQPILFHLFMFNPMRKKEMPYTFVGFVMTFISFSVFMLGCLFLTLVSVILLIVPVNTERKKVWFHKLIQRAVILPITIYPLVKRRNFNQMNERFDKPAVIIANHQSFVDILILLSLSPKLLMITNNWVYNSKLFGWIVRYGDFYSTSAGYENAVEVLSEKVKQGYSVIVFPEGTRSFDLKMKKFHKGAFFLAEKLNIDILPIVLYGHGMIVSKNQPFYVKPGIISYKILPRIKHDDLSFGETYQERTKHIGAYFRTEYQQLCDHLNTVDNPYFYYKLIQNYIYKGPVVEWYMRVKVKMEDNYRQFDEIIPKEAVITDIGCGYGPLVYMLSFLSEKREIVGIDYDEEKISIANNCFSKSNNVSFIHANALECDLPESDVFILNDMLHYLPYPAQMKLIERCIVKLRKGGKIVVRDGNSEKKNRHRITRLTEILSTKVFRFNKVDGDLYFTDHDKFVDLARNNKMRIKTRENDNYTSNTIYILNHE